MFLPGFDVSIKPGAGQFVVMVLLWTTVKVPALMRRHLSQGGQSTNVLGAVVRVVMVQQLGRAIPGVGRGMRAVTAR